ncbi:frataxin, mitochondrial [Hordeum vulgare]|nr:frataxin, mitochondrial [Hordeum vulgare]
MASRKLLFGLTAARRASPRASVRLSVSPLLEASTSASHAAAPLTKPSGGSPWALLFSPRAFSSTPPAQQSAGDVPAPSAVDHKLIMPEDKFHKLADDTIHDLLEKLEEYGDSQQMDGFDIDYGDSLLASAPFRFKE